MIKIIFLFLLIFITIYENNKVCADDLEIANDHIKFMDDYQKKINQIVKKITKNNKETKEAQLKKLFTRLVSTKFDMREIILSSKANFYLKMPNFLEYATKVSPQSPIQEIEDLTTEIHTHYAMFTILTKSRKDQDNSKLAPKKIKKNTDKFFRKAQFDEDLVVLYDKIMESDLLDDLINSIKNSNENEICGDKGSPQEIIYNFYTVCLSLELLIITTIVNGNAIYQIIEPNNGFEDELNESIAQSKERIKNYSNKFLSKLEELPKKYRNCDPYGKEKHKRDETFTEMFGLYQRILLFSHNLVVDDRCLICEAVNLKNGTNAKECYTQLNNPPTPWKENGEPESIKDCTTPRNCFGTVSRCRTIINPEFCIPKNSTRRYYWLRDLQDKTKDENQFGQHDYCDESSQSLKTESTSYGTRCTFCFCTCADETPNSVFTVNTVSLLPSLSNVLKNRVVIGVRIIVQNNMLHIQVREAKIDKNYKIAKDGPDRWVKIPDISNDVKESRLNNNQSKLNEFEHYIAWKENTTGFNFDEISLEYGRLITGVKFGMSQINEENNSNRIQIEVQSMKYNYKNGKLIDGSQKWHRSNSEHPKFIESGAKVSTMTNEKTIIDSSTDQWGHLEVSNDRSDAGQTTVPLFDAQTIQSLTNAPLAGIGFHHRTSDEKYSGFYGLTAYSIDYYQFLKETNKN